MIIFYQFSGLDTRGNHTCKIVHMLFCSDLQHTLFCSRKGLVHVMQRHSYLHQSQSQDMFRRLSNCDSPSQLISLQCNMPLHSKCDALSQLFTPDSQPRHGDSNSSGGSAIVTHHHMRRTVTANILSLSHS